MAEREVWASADVSHIRSGCTKPNTYLHSQISVLEEAPRVLADLVVVADVGWTPAAGPGLVDAAVGAGCLVSAIPCRIFASPISVSAWCAPVPVAESTKSRTPPLSLSPAPTERLGTDA